MMNFNSCEEKQGREIIRCCICGDYIAVKEGNNPYPVREWSAFGSDENRCCHKCNREFVLPSRMMSGNIETDEEYDKFHEKLKAMPYKELKRMFRPYRIA